MTRYGPWTDLPEQTVHWNASDPGARALAVGAWWQTYVYTTSGALTLADFLAVANSDVPDTALSRKAPQPIPVPPPALPTGYEPGQLYGFTNDDNVIIILTADSTAPAPGWAGPLSWKMAMVALSPTTWPYPTPSWPTPPPGASIETQVTRRPLDVTASVFRPGGLAGTVDLWQAPASAINADSRETWPTRDKTASWNRLTTLSETGRTEVTIPAAEDGYAYLAASPAWVRLQDVTPQTWQDAGTSLWLDRIVSGRARQEARYRFVYESAGYPRLRQRQAAQPSDGPGLRGRQHGGFTGAEPLRQRQRGI